MYCLSAKFSFFCFEKYFSRGFFILSLEEYFSYIFLGKRLSMGILGAIIIISSFQLSPKKSKTAYMLLKNEKKKQIAEKTIFWRILKICYFCAKAVHISFYLPNFSKEILFLLKTRKGHRKEHNALFLILFLREWTCLNLIFRPNVLPWLISLRKPLSETYFCFAKV